LLNTEKALGIPKTLIIGIGKGYKNELSKALRGLQTRNLSIVLPEDIKKNKQFFLGELQHHEIKWKKASSHNIGIENLTVLKDIRY